MRAAPVVMVSSHLLSCPNISLPARVDLPSKSSSFVKPLESLYPPAPCRFCRGEGNVPCDRCGGRGVLGKGGYHTRNRVDHARIIGSKWTAMETTFGWRHFEVVSKQKGGKDWFLELVATCDQNTRFWLNSHNLKDRERWSMGWLQKEETSLAQGKGISRISCKSCRGMGRLRCVACEKKGQAVDIIEI